MKTPQQRKEYRERVRKQTLKWCFGVSEHNKVDDECCPDFSCCRPELSEGDSNKRWEYYNKEFSHED